MERYGLLGLDILTDLPTANPYDPGELDIRVRFTAPSGSEMEVGAFWYQAFDPGTRLPTGDPGWKARFTPTETGRWIAVAQVPALGLRSDPVAFRVDPSDRPGFVRVHPANARYLAFDNGDFFFPIGLNLGWWGGSSDALTDYRRWLTAFSANGGNTIRVWMCSLSFSIEWKGTPLGDYGPRQKQAWLLDQLLRMAEERGVYVILVLLTHCQFSEWEGCEWKDDPYNAALGGPLDSPGQFATDPTARALFQQRLNYIVNRWGYSPNLLAWEWWNEVNLTPIRDGALIPWLQEMTAFLRQRDVNRRLTTSSYAIRDQSPIWQLPELDIIQKHEYSDQVGSESRDLAERAALDYRRLAESAPAKPILLGEFGYSARNYGDDVEKTGIHLHNGLWAAAFAGCAGSGMYWWWDIYVEANNLWHHFDGLAQFLAAEDLTQYQPFSPLQFAGVDGAPGQAIGLGLCGQDTLVWFRNCDYTVQASVAAREAALEAGAAPSFTFEPPLVENQVLTLHQMVDGDYTVRWFDPQTAQWLGEAVATAQNDTLTIAIPPFSRDLAAKIERKP